jgi:hypothetical protein
MTTQTPPARVPTMKHELRAAPSTEALDQHTSDFAVLPGYPAYQKWSELLQEGKIDYADFVDWISRGSHMKRRDRVRALLETLLDGMWGGLYRGR